VREHHDTTGLTAFKSLLSFVIEESNDLTSFRRPSAVRRVAAYSAEQLISIPSLMAPKKSTPYEVILRNRELGVKPGDGRG
jgi:hypothetical protein